MSKAKKALTDHLVAAVVPHLGPVAEGNQPPKAVAKTVRKLAKQLLKQQGKVKKGKAEKAPTPPAAPTAKRARKALAGELTSTLQPYLGAEQSTSKSVAKTIKRLASELVKQRRKQDKNTAKGTPPTALEPAARTKKPQPSRPTPVAPPRRSAPPKRPVAKAAPALEAAAEPTTSATQE